MLHSTLDSFLYLAIQGLDEYQYGGFAKEQCWPQHDDGKVILPTVVKYLREKKWGRMILGGWIELVFEDNHLQLISVIDGIGKKIRDVTTGEAQTLVCQFLLEDEKRRKIRNDRNDFINITFHIYGPNDMLPSVIHPNYRNNGVDFYNSDPKIYGVDPPKSERY